MHTLKKITETTETETLSSSLIHLKSSKSMRYDIFNRKAPAMRTACSDGNSCTCRPFN